eukprot:5480203-Pleurochrysis_carterae.AAC.1
MMNAQISTHKHKWPKSTKAPIIKLLLLCSLLQAACTRVTPSAKGVSQAQDRPPWAVLARPGRA